MGSFSLPARQPYAPFRLAPRWASSLAFISLSGQPNRRDLKSLTMPVTTGTINQTAGLDGPASLPADRLSRYSWTGLTPIANMSDGYTVLLVAAPVAEATLDRMVVIGDEAATNYTAAQLIFNADNAANVSSGRWAFVEYSNGFKGTAMTAVTALDGNRHVFIVKRLPGTEAPYQYQDGVYVSTSPANSSGSAFTAGVHLHGAPTSSTVGSPYPAELIVIFNRAISDGEMVLLSRNPWQLFQPSRARVYAFPASAATSFNPYTPWPQMQPIMAQ